MNYPFIPFDSKVTDASVLPTTSGNYLIVLRPSCKLPTITIEPLFSSFKYNDGEAYDVIYTGISQNLQTRDYKQHFTGNNAGKSTLRKSLGCLMGFKQIPRDSNNPDNGKTKFCDTDEKKLSTWMKDNLLLFYFANNEYEKLELELIAQYNPPLNLKNNHNPINREYRSLLSNLRSSKTYKQENDVISSSSYRNITPSFSNYLSDKTEKKGKTSFTKVEIKKLKVLIENRCNASRDEQKKIRNQMRNIGFYGRDDFGIIDMTIEKFEGLIKTEKIKIVN